VPAAPVPPWPDLSPLVSAQHRRAWIAVSQRHGAPEDLAPAAADLLLKVMQDPGLQARYLKNVLPLVADVRVGRSWVETH